MAILLHNLLARSPKLTDLPAISALFAACAKVEDGCHDSVVSEQDVLVDWCRPGFNLDNHAWIITTKQGQVVSYADLWMDEQGRIELRVRVHPNYGRRGIGTLLLRLGEDRARCYARKTYSSSHARITLSSVVSRANSHAQDLLEQEGYLPIQHVWRFSIKSDEMLGDSGTSAGTVKMHTFDLYLDSPDDQQCVGIASLAASHDHTGIYSARQYVVYEKELWSNADVSTRQELCAAV